MAEEVRWQVIAAAQRKLTGAWARMGLLFMGLLFLLISSPDQVHCFIGCANPQQVCQCISI